MKKIKKIYQVINRNTDKLYNWFESQEKAEAELEECRQNWPNEIWEIEEGTSHIYIKCRGCESVYCNMQHDVYGIPTGNWCDECYNSDKYPYRKDQYYDPCYAGERLEFE